MKRLNSHLDRCRPIVLRLAMGGRLDADVISLLLIETFFRSHLHRLVELAAWPVVWLMWPSRLATLSVGPGQIQLQHWMRTMGWASLAPTWSRLRLVLSWEASYDVVDGLTANAETTQRRAAIHRGEARSYHVKCLMHAVSWLRAMQPGRNHRYAKPPSMAIASD